MTQTRPSPSSALPSRARSRLIAAFAAIAVAACTRGDGSAARPAADSTVAAPQMAPADQPAMVGFEMAQSRRAAAPPSSPVAAPQQALPRSPVAGTMIIRNGQVTVEVDSLEVAVERVRQLAVALGGGVGNVFMNTGARQLRSATLEMKIPSARFDDAMTGLAPIGKVEQSTSTAEDVGEEFVDITARLANARRLETRLLDLLANRTGKLEDVLRVERELARVREEIERHEGRIRYLGTRVATSTVVATMHEKAPIVAAPGTSVIGNAFLGMWRNFVRFVAGLIEALGILVPVALLGGLAWWTWRRWRPSTLSP